MSICAVCGDRTAQIDGYTRDNRVILTCGDAVVPEKVSPWTRGAKLHPECRGAYRSDRAHGLVYPRDQKSLDILMGTCLYCRTSLRRKK